MVLMMVMVGGYGSSHMDFRCHWIYHTAGSG